MIMVITYFASIGFTGVMRERSVLNFDVTGAASSSSRSLPSSSSLCVFALFFFELVAKHALHDQLQVVRVLICYTAVSNECHRITWCTVMLVVMIVMKVIGKLLSRSWWWWG